MKQGIEIAGTIIVDSIKEIDRYPNQGELVYIDRSIKSVGGLVPNVSIDIKKIDSSIDVLVSGTIGDDENGKFVKDYLRNNNVNQTNLRMTNNLTSYTDVISIKGGQRTFLNYRGAADDFGFDDISFEYSMLHLGYFTLLKKVDEIDGLKILKQAKEKGIVTSIDMVSSNVECTSVIKCLPYVDNLIINEFEAGKILNIVVDGNNLIKSAKKLKELGVINRVIIHMPQKSCCVDNKTAIEMDSLNIPRDLIIGTTGAGDAFCSGCLVGIYNNYNNEEILKFASCVAASSLFSPDATSSVISLNEIESFYQKYRS